MTDFEQIVKKSVKCKKNPRVIGVLKELVGTTRIIKRILDLEINLTVDKLLTSALVVEKQLIKTSTKDKAIQF